MRLVRKANSYYAQLCIAQDRTEDVAKTGSLIGIDVGLESFLTDSNGEKVENPRFLRNSEKRLKKLQRRLSQKVKDSNNRKKAQNRLGRKHLRVSNQRKDFAVKLARCVMISNDIVVIEDLKVRNMLKNSQLAKSISDASWSMFRDWLAYFAKIFDKQLIAVSPHYTSQECSKCKEVSINTNSYL